MSEQSPKLRMVTEGAVIVASILLAFGIQAWWEKLGERRTEQELLGSLLEDVETTQEVLSDILSRTERDRAGVHRFSSKPQDELSAVPRDTARAIFTSLYRPNTFDPLVRSSLSGVLNTAQVSLIQDSRLRTALNEWLVLATELDERNASAAALELVINRALGHHEVYRRRWLRGPDALPDSVDLRAIRDDVQVMGPTAVLMRYREQQLTYSRRVLSRLGGIKELLTELRR